MKKLALIISVLCVILILGSTCFAAAPSSDYELLINDEFDGNALNSSIWTYRVGNVSGGRNDKENIRIADGKLFIDYVLRDGVYTGGGIISMDCLGYGYYETKAKVYDGANGLHTSFWNSGGGGESIGKYHAPDNRMIEIDGFEFNSNQTSASPVPAYNLHYWWLSPSRSGGSARYDVETDGDSSTPDWFTMGFEYLPDKVIYYANGKEVGRNDLSVYGMAHLKLTALAQPDNYLNDDGTYNIDNTQADENGYFGSSEYEYVKYYQKKLKGVNLFGNGHFEFNRKNSSTPKCFYYENNAIVNFSPYANNGMCYASLSGESRMGQKIAYISGGNYTLGGYFKTFDDADARLVVYDRQDNEIKSMPIPECKNWTYISMTDIQITDYAFAVVETKKGILAIDDFEFFCQEGDDSYLNYHDSDYENYPAFSHDSNYIVKERDQAEKSAHNWGSSSITGVQNSYVSTGYSSLVNSSAPYKNVWGSYTIEVPNDDIYDIEVYRIFYENNVPSQTYTITMDDVEICSPVTLDTYSAEASNDIVKLCTVSAKKGQVIKVKITCNDFGGFSMGNKYFRITPLQLASQTDKLMESAIVTYVSSPFYQYQNSPYAFDAVDEKLVPYKENDEIYIPYQAIKDKISVSGIADDAKYISATEINSNPAYKASSDGTVVIIYSSEYTINDLLYTTAYTKLTRFTGPKPSDFSEAEYKGTNDEYEQEVYAIDDCMQWGSWGNSSLGYNNTSRYALGKTAKAIWSVYPAKDLKYSIQVYSIAHNGSSAGTTSAGVTLFVGDKQHTYAIDQRNGETGWHDLGTFDVTKDTPVIFSMYNNMSGGQLRVSAVRLVPVFEEPEFAGTLDAAYQELFGFDSATKTGTWKITGSSSPLAGCYYGYDEGASITWTPVPSASKKYSVQFYNPLIEQSSTSNNSHITLTVDEDARTWKLDQRKTSDNMGWYDLGTYELSPESEISVTINKGSSSYVRAKAIRLVPVLDDPVLVGNTDARNQEYHDYSSAVKVGDWIKSGNGALSGCYYAKNYSSLTWEIYPNRTNTYSIQVYNPCYNQNATTNNAKLALVLDGTEYKWTLDQYKSTSENIGWYELGSFELDAQTPITFKMENDGVNGVLRAKGIRLVPVLADPLYVGNTDINGQEYFGFSDAVTTGTWRSSSGALSGCYYGSSNPTITWTPVPSASKSYNIQIFNPCYNQNSTTSDAKVTLTIDGVTYNWTLNQFKATKGNIGWYDLGTFDLTLDSEITLKLEKGGSTFLRAKGIRLVPLASTPSVTKSGAAAIINLGEISTKENVLLYRECDSTGKMVKTFIIKQADAFTSIPMENTENSVKLFMWKNIQNMIPIRTTIELN